MSNAGFFRSLAAMITLYAPNSLGNLASRLPTPLLPVKQHRRGMPREVGIDMRYIGSAWKRVQNSKSYPHSSDRQNERYRRNYGCTEDGTIFPVSDAMRKNIAAKSLFAQGE